MTASELGEGEVWASPKGKLFHTQRCEVVQQRPSSMRRVPLADVADRQSCYQCTGAPELGQQFKFERGEWLRLDGELNRLARTIADILVVKGPEGVSKIGAHVVRYRETKADLDKLSRRVSGAPPGAPDSPNW